MVYGLRQVFCITYGDHLDYKINNNLNRFVPRSQGLLVEVVITLVALQDHYGLIYSFSILTHLPHHSGLG